MPLHDRDTVREQLEDSVFAGRDLTRPVPKYRFPRDETLSAQAFQVVSDELMLYGNARQNLATFCQTWVEPEVIGLMALSLNKEYPPPLAGKCNQGEELARQPGRIVQPAAPFHDLPAQGRRQRVLLPRGRGADADHTYRCRLPQTWGVSGVQSVRSVHIE